MLREFLRFKGIVLFSSRSQRPLLKGTLALGLAAILIFSSLRGFLLLGDVVTQASDGQIGGASKRRTYIVNLDGMQAEYYNYFYSGPNSFRGWLTPNLMSFAAHGQVYYNCYNVLTALTGTNHVSIITSTSAGTNGVLGVGVYYKGLNLAVSPSDEAYGTAVIERYDHDDILEPTLFNMIPSLTTAVVAGKPWVGDMFDDADCDIKVYPENPTNPSYVSSTVQGYILGGRPHLGDQVVPARYYLPESVGQPAELPPSGFPVYNNTGGWDFPLTAQDMPSDKWIFDQAIKVIDNDDPDFMYILAANMDEAGHFYGSFVDSGVSNLNSLRNPDAARDQLYLTDMEFGRFISHLEVSGKLSDTVIVVTSDHGMSSMKNALFSVDLRKILADNGLCMKADDRSPTGTYNASGVYDWLYSEGPASYLYNVSPAYIDQMAELLENYCFPGNEFPVWIVLDKIEQRDGINWYTGRPYNLYHADFGSVVWPDLIVILNPHYMAPLYYDILTGGANAFMLDFNLPPTGDADLKTAPGAHGTYLEQHVPLIVTGPSVIAGGQVYTQVSTLDIVPTICSLNGWPTPTNAEGISLPMETPPPPPPPPPLPSGPIKIGIVGPYGHPFWSPGMKEAAEMARNEINADGGVHLPEGDFEIELAFGDESSYPLPDPVSAYMEAERLITIEECQYLIGGVNPECTSAMIEAAADYATPFFIDGAFSAELLEDTVNLNYPRYKYLFRTNPVNSTMMFYTIAGALGGHLIPTKLLPLYGHDLDSDPETPDQVRIAVLAEDLSWTQVMYTYMTDPSIYTSVLGPYANVTYFDRIPDGTIDVSPWLSAVDASQARLIIHIFSGASGVPLAVQWEEMNLNTMLVGINMMAQRQTYWLDTGGACEYESIISFAGTRTPIVPGVTEVFWDNFVAYTGTWPLYTACGVYDSIYVLKESLEAIASRDQDALVAYWEGSYERTGLSGKQKFTNSHDVYCDEYLPTWINGYARAMFVQWVSERMEVVCPVDQTYSKRWTIPPWMYSLQEDLNYDGKVDIRDVALVARAFGSSPGDPRWEKEADLNYDNKIDIKDIARVAREFGAEITLPLP